jgi:hypothetical protein
MAVFTPAWVVNNSDSFVLGIFDTEQAARNWSEQFLTSPVSQGPITIIPVTRVTEDPE